MVHKKSSSDTKDSQWLFIIFECKNET
jgi:hypothetical protein